MLLQNWYIRQPVTVVVFCFWPYLQGLLLACLHIFWQKHALLGNLFPMCPRFFLASDLSANLNLSNLETFLGLRPRNVSKFDKFKFADRSDAKKNRGHIGNKFPSNACFCQKICRQAKRRPCRYGQKQKTTTVTG